MTKIEDKYLKLAIKKSRESASKGLFPAGSVVVKDGKILSSEISSPFPDPRHADTKAIEKAFDGEGRLNGAVLYSSAEPCLMCLSEAYWAGVREIVYAIKKQAVKKEYYEGGFRNEDVVKKFNERIKLVHAKDYQSIAMEIVKEWEKRLK